jgi:hypothetical protein
MIKFQANHPISNIIQKLIYKICGAEKEGVTTVTFATNSQQASSKTSFTAHRKKRTPTFVINKQNFTTARVYSNNFISFS